MDKARSFPYDEGRKDGMPMEIGAKLRQARIAAGLTQEQTAEALGVSRQSISNWENEKNYPDIVSVVRLSDLYAVSLDALLKEEAPMSDYLDYLEKLVNDIIAKWPAGELPPCDQVTQRFTEETLEDLKKGPLKGGKHIYTVAAY